MCKLFLAMFSYFYLWTTWLFEKPQEFPEDEDY